MAEKYKSPFEVLFGDKSWLIMATSISAVTMALFVTYFQIDRSSRDTTRYLEQTLQMQSIELSELKDELKRFHASEQMTNSHDEILADIKSQLDIIRRDIAKSVADSSRLQQQLGKLQSSVDEINVEIQK